MVSSYYNNNYKHIYTDGSKMDEKVAAAAVTDSEIFVNHLADHSLIFTAEARAVDLAVEHFKKTNNKNYIIFSDSMPYLQAFLQNSPINHKIVRVLEKYNQLKSRGKDIIFFSIPGHVSIKGNEEADEAAKYSFIMMYWQQKLFPNINIWGFLLEHILNFTHRIHLIFCLNAFDIR